MVRSNIPSSKTVYDSTILGATAGTATASKALIVDASIDIDTLGDVGLENLDAGSSGTAGTVDVFPGTASKGKIAITAANSTGDTTTTIVNAAQAAARTYTIPDALAAAEFLLGQQGAVARTATADGLTTGTIADAGMFQFIAVTAGGDANSIIVLPTPTPGTIIVLYVGATGYELRTDTPASVAINGGTGAGAEAAIAANQMAVLICTSATTWHGFEITAATLTAIEAAA